MSRQNVFKSSLFFIRKKYKETQQGNARRGSVYPSYITKIEAQDCKTSRNITINDLEKLERAYNVKIELKITDRDGNIWVV